METRSVGMQDHFKLTFQLSKEKLKSYSAKSECQKKWLHLSVFVGKWQVGEVLWFLIGVQLETMETFITEMKEATCKQAVHAHVYVLASTGYVREGGAIVILDFRLSQFDC